MLDFLKKCFAINLNDYENISFSLEINKVVLGASVALIIGVILLNTYRGSIRLVIMQLTRHGAKSEESAKTLSELGLDKSRIVKYLLRGSNVLTKTVARVGEKKYSYEEYVALGKEERAKSEEIDYSSAAFYIREDQADRGNEIIEKYTASVTRTVLACVFVGIVCICVIACMPGILNAVDHLLENIKK